MKKRIIFLLLIFLCSWTSVHADTRTINGNDFQIYKRTKEEIKNKWEIGRLEIPETIFEVEPSYQAPYQAGVVKQSYLDEVKDNLNYYRYLTGTPEIEISPENNEDLQTAEVVQYLYYKSTENIHHDLASNFPKPNDMEEEFYQRAINAHHQIISTYGYQNPIFPFFDESTFTSTAGHRITLLRPEITYAEYGLGNIVYGVVEGSYSQFDKMTNEFAAYPSPGYFPKQDFNGESDWDIYLNDQEFLPLTEEEQNNVEVTIKDKTLDLEYKRTIKDGNLEFNEDSIIIFSQPEKVTTYYENEYEVTITNLKDKEGNPVNLTYTVTFFDKYEGIESPIKSAIFDMYFTGVHFDENYNEKLTKKILEDIGLNISLESGAEISQKIKDFNIEFFNLYAQGEKLYYAHPIINDLPEWVKDPNHILNNTQIYVLAHTETQQYRYAYGNTNYTKNKGEEATLSIEDFYSDYDANVLYKWVKEKNEEFELLEETEKYETDGLNLNIKNLTKEDEGNYYLMTFVQPTGYYNTYFYLSKPLNLTVKNPITTLSFDSDKLNLTVHQEEKLNLIINPEDTDENITWSSNDESIVSVDEEGNIKALKKGTATITASSETNISTSIEITVTDILKGDMNKNSTIDFADVIIALKKYLNIEEINDDDLAIGDMNENSEIDFADIISILRKYLEID